MVTDRQTVKQGQLVMATGSNSPDPVFPRAESRDLAELSIVAKSNAGGGLISVTGPHQ